MILCHFKGMDIFILKYILRSMGPNAIITSKEKAMRVWEEERRVPGFTASVSSTLRIKPWTAPGTCSPAVRVPLAAAGTPLAKGLLVTSLSAEPNPGGFACRHHWRRQRWKKYIGRDKKKKKERKERIEYTEKSVGHLETSHAPGGQWVPQPSSWRSAIFMSPCQVPTGKAGNAERNLIRE